jgi:SAM-dependent methyltransferase
MPRNYVRKADRKLRLMQSGETYFLPRHPTENDRLNLLAFATGMAMGAGWLSPVTGPGPVLDVGCGTGLWAYGFGRRFPAADVLGVDIVDFRDDGAPPNFRFQEVNVLQGLPFPNDTFELVHQRLMAAVYPTERYGQAVAELVRVTSPGGHVELFESRPFIEPEGPATKELWDFFRKLGREKGLDTAAMIPERLESYLAAAGLEGIETREFDIPVGEWGAELGEWQRRAGELILRSHLSLLTRMCPVFAALGVTEDRCRELIETMADEVNEVRSVHRFKTTFGRKPSKSV